MKFELIFTRGLQTVAHIKGIRELSKEELNLKELEQVITTEQFIEKLTGLRVHINEMEA
jgi:hypothetical protein